MKKKNKTTTDKGAENAPPVLTFLEVEHILGDPLLVILQPNA